MRILTRSLLICGIALLSLVSANAQAPLADRKALTLDTAKKMVEAAEKFATANQWHMVIVVMDDGGNLLCLERMDGSPLGSITVAQEKAKSSVNFGGPSKNFEDSLAKGNHSVLRLPVMPYEGALPITAGGRLIGAIGVSGGSAAQDGQVAKAGLDWLQQALK